MSWTYSGNPSSNTLDECRFMIGDTLIDEPIMQDEEIQYLINTCTSKDKLLTALYTNAATIFARDIKRTIGPLSEDPTERLKYFTAQAAYYKAKSGSTGISLPANMSPKVFTIGMQSNNKGT